MPAEPIGSKLFQNKAYQGRTRWIERPVRAWVYGMKTSPRLRADTHLYDLSPMRIETVHQTTNPVLPPRRMVSAADFP